MTPMKLYRVVIHGVRARVEERDSTGQWTSEDWPASVTPEAAIEIAVTLARANYKRAMAAAEAAESARYRAEAVRNTIEVLLPKEQRTPEPPLLKRDGFFARLFGWRR